jgi:hypothetical protein
MLKNFFLTCAGVDQNLIDNCSNSEQNKYVGIGGTIFFTAIMATIAGSYALYTVFDNVYSAIFFGIIWGLLIFNLDRFIVATIKKTDAEWNEFLQASPRIVLAVIIAIVISKPLELKLFEKEINQILLGEKNQMTLDNKAQIAAQFTPKITKKKIRNRCVKGRNSFKRIRNKCIVRNLYCRSGRQKRYKIIGKRTGIQRKKRKT